MESHHYENAIKLIKLYKFEDALKAINQAIFLNDKNYLYFSTRAGIKNCLFQFKEAIEDTKKALELDETFIKSHIQQGFAYYKLGEYKQALKAYIRAQKKEPDNQQLLQFMTQTQRKIEELKEQEEEQKNNPQYYQEEEYDMLKDLYTKISMNKNYCHYLKNTQFVFQLELIDKSPQLSHVLQKHDPILRKVLQDIQSNESNLSAQEQQQNNENKDLFKKEQDTQLQEESEEQEQEQEEIQEVKKEKQVEVEANKEVEQQGDLGSLSNMEGVFSLMAQEINSSTQNTGNDNDNPLMKLFKRLDIAVQEPGNILEKEDKEQKLKTHSKTNQLQSDSQQTGSTSMSSMSGGTSTFTPIYMPNNIDRENNNNNSSFGKVTYAQGSNSTSNMVSIGQAFDLEDAKQKQQGIDTQYGKINYSQGASTQISEQQSSSSNMISLGQSFDLESEKKNQKSLDTQYGTINYSNSGSISSSSSNMASLGQSFNLEKEKKDQTIGKNEQEITDQQQQKGKGISEEKSKIFEDIGITIRKKGKNTNKKDKSEKTYEVKTVGTADVFENEEKQKLQLQVEKLKITGIRQAKERQYGASVVTFNKALQLDPQNFQIQVFKISSLLPLNNFLQAEEIVQNLLKEYQKDAFKIEIINDLDNLIQTQKNKYEKEQTQINSQQQQASQQLKLQHINMVAGDLEKFSKEDSKELIELIKMGDKLFSIGKYEYAKDEFINALKIDPKNPEVHLKLSNCYLKLRLLEKGLESINECLKIDNRNQLYWLKKGYIHIFLKEFKMAQAAFELGLDLNPESEDLIKGLTKVKELMMVQN